MWLMSKEAKTKRRRRLAENPDKIERLSLEMWERHIRALSATPFGFEAASRYDLPKRFGGKGKPGIIIVSPREKIIALQWFH